MRSIAGLRLPLRDFILVGCAGIMMMTCTSEVFRSTATSATPSTGEIFCGASPAKPIHFESAFYPAIVAIAKSQVSPARFFKQVQGLGGSKYNSCPFGIDTGTLNQSAFVVVSFDQTSYWQQSVTYGRYKKLVDAEFIALRSELRSLEECAPAHDSSCRALAAKYGT
jgi:hypothetical protein